jgi:hypothetical protein
VYKILNKEKVEYIYPGFEAFNFKILSYENTKYFCDHVNNPLKIIKYFYKLIKINKD